MTAGRLYLVPTPLGNLEDITLRALRVLKEVDRIACEDTRRTAKLLAHYGIRTPTLSFHEHNESARTPRLLEFLREGNALALVCDAGTPLISDPGYELVSRCREEDIEVVPLPGPMAAVAAISASGLPTDSFFFAGFLPPRSGEKRKRLRQLASVGATLVFYEAPHRILATLETMAEELGPRRACLVRELSKVHEEWLRGDLTEILAQLRGRDSIKGEITLVVDRGDAPGRGEPWPASISAHLAEEMRAAGTSRKEALRTVARRRGITRREAYRLLLEESREGKDAKNGSGADGEEK